MRRLLISLLLFTLFACTRAPQSETTEIYVFGTLVGITTWGAETAQRDAALREISQTFQHMHHQWHAWKPGPLVDINQSLAAGENVQVPPSIADLIRRSQLLYRQSEGLFNPAIGGLLQLWGFQSDGRPNGPPPSDQKIRQWVEAAPGMDDLEFVQEQIRSKNPAVQLDFGAFAKGVAVDSAIDILQKHGIDNAIVNGGGDLRAIGRKGDSPWRVGIRHPQGQGILASLEVTGDESVFTSGNYERYREHEGVRYPHILDPRTGMPVNGITSVTVLHSNGGVADAAATALVVAGVESWQRIAHKMGIKHAMLVDDVGTVHITPALHRRLKFSIEPDVLRLSPPL